MSQGIEEIRHFLKSLGILFTQLPRHLQKLQEFPEMPMQLGKLLIFLIYLRITYFWEKANVKSSVLTN